jgi:gliding motility-associated-like protein
VGSVGTKMSVKPTIIASIDNGFIDNNLTTLPWLDAKITVTNNNPLLLTVKQQQADTARIAAIYIQHDGTLWDTIYILQPAKICPITSSADNNKKFVVTYLENYMNQYIDSAINLFIYASAIENTNISITNPNGVSLPSAWDDYAAGGTKGKTKTYVDAYMIDTIYHEVLDIKYEIFTHPGFTIPPIPRYADKPALTPAWTYNYKPENVSQHNSVFIEADKPISLYAYNAAAQSSEAASILPIEALGYEYMHLSHPISSGYPVTIEEFVVAATEDNTIVTIDLRGYTTIGYAQNRQCYNGACMTPSLCCHCGFTSAACSSKKADDVYVVRLNKGATYLVKPQNNNDMNDYSNLTNRNTLAGTYIMANKPIAVFSGHQRAFIGAVLYPNASRDNLYEQLLPLNLWGNKYIVVNSTLKPIFNNFYRIMAASDSTNITITQGSGMTTTSTTTYTNRLRGSILEGQLSNGMHALIESNKPVSVMFYEPSGCLQDPQSLPAYCDNGPGNPDPFMLTVSPLTNAANEVIFAPFPFFANTADTNNRHYVTFIVETKYKHLTEFYTKRNIVEDVYDLTGLWTDMNNGYSYITKNIKMLSNKNYYIRNPYGAVSYAFGHGTAESYGYNLGMNYVETTTEIMKDTCYCGGETPMQLPAQYDGKSVQYYKNMQDWRNSAAMPSIPAISANADTIYDYYYSVQNECGAYPTPLHVGIGVMPGGTMTFPDKVVCIASNNTDYGARPRGGVYTYENPATHIWEPFNHQTAGVGTFNVVYTYSAASDTMGKPGARKVCSRSDTAVIEVHDFAPWMELLPGASTTICQGNSVALLVGGNNVDSLRWKWNDTINISGLGLGPIISGGTVRYDVSPSAGKYQTGKYSAYLYSGGCEVALDTMVRIIEPPKKPVIKPDAPVGYCTGNSVVLHDSVDRGIYYRWEKMTGGVTTNNISSAYNYTSFESAVGTYRYILGAATTIAGFTPSNYCWSYDTVFVGVNDIPSLSAISMVDGQMSVPILCSRGEHAKMAVILSGTTYSQVDSIVWKWNSTENLGGACYNTSGCMYDINANSAKFATGRYAAYAYVGSCYAKTDTAITIVAPPPAPQIADYNHSIVNRAIAMCAGDSARLYDNNLGSGNYQWFANTIGNPIAGAAQNTRTISAAGRYILGKGAAMLPRADFCYNYDTVTINVISPPTLNPITISGDMLPLCAGGSITLEVSGTNIDSIRWHRDGTPVGAVITNIANNQIVQYALQPSMGADYTGGRYAAYAYKGGLCTAVVDTMINIVSAAQSPIPVISAAGQSMSAAKQVQYCAGDSVKLQYTAYNGAFQWYKDGTAITGAAANSLKVYNASGAYSLAFAIPMTGQQAPNYCWKYDTVSIAVKPLPTLNVTSFNANGPAAPTICSNESITLQAAQITPAAYDSIRWKYNGVPIAGAINPNYALSPPAQSGSYSAHVYKDGCAAAAAITAVVVPPPAKPNISAYNQQIVTATTPHSIVYDAGDSAKLYDAAGSAANAYQWYSHSISGGTTTMLNGDSAQIYTVREAAAGAYRYIAASGTKIAGRQRSGYCWAYDTVDITINALPVLGTMQLSTTPVICRGESITLQVSGANIDSIVWRRGTTRVGAKHMGNSAYYRVSPDSGADYQSGVYTATAYNGTRLVTSSVSITIQNPPAPPVITAANQNIVNDTIKYCDGDSAVMREFPPRNYPYQWRYNGSAMPADTFSEYKSANQSGMYSLGIATPIAGRTRAAYCWSYDTINVVVNPTLAASIIAVGRPDFERCENGDTLTLSAIAAGLQSGITGYDWTYNGAHFAATQNVKAAAAGVYKAVVMGLGSCNAQASVQVIVRPSPNKPSILRKAASVLCQGEIDTMLVANVIAGETYTWLKAADSSIIYQAGPGGRAASYAVNQAGSFLVLAEKNYSTNLTCASYSDARTITFNATPMAPVLHNRIAGGSDSSCTGDTIHLAVRAAAGDATPIVDWQWFKDGAVIAFASDSIYNVVPYGGLAQGAFKARTITANGCMSPYSNERMVLIDPPVNMRMNYSDWMCDGQSKLLSAPSHNPLYIYQWFKNGQILPGRTESTYDVTSSGIVSSDYTDYYQISLDIARCPQPFMSDSMALTVRARPANPVVNGGQDIHVCENGNVVFNAVSAGSTKYRWYRNGSTLLAEVDNLNYYQLNTVRQSDMADYTAEAENYWGCKAERRSTPIYLEVQPLPSIYIGPRQACSSQTDFPYAQPPGGWFRCAAGCEDSTKFNPSTAGSDQMLTYIVESAQPLRCRSEYQHYVEVLQNPPPPQIYTHNSLWICPSATGNILMQTTAIPPVRYQWFKDGTAIPNGISENYTALNKGVYTLMVSNQMCEASARSNPLEVQEYPKSGAPSIAAVSGEYAFCPGDSVVLYSLSPASGVFSWHKMYNGQPQPSDGAIDPFYIVREAGDYTAAYYDENTCLSEYSDIIPISVLPVPDTPRILSEAVKYYLGLNYKLTIYMPKTQIVYQWYRNGASTGAAGVDFYINKLKSEDIARYAVMAVNSYGCHTLSKEYAIEEVSREFTIPNIFTPNGDGLNDYFEIVGLEEFAETKLEVVNKNGVLVYSSKNYNNDWDGVGFASDIYYYTLTLKSHDGKTQTHRGFVHIKRDSD